MKETSVDIGKTYALRSLTGGEVQNANGDVIKTLDAGKQQHETAQESVWLVPDDCQVTKANFKCALAALGLLGGGETSGLPAGYTRVDFLESTGKQNILFSDLQTGESFGIDYTFLKTENQKWACSIQENSVVHYRIDVRSWSTAGYIRLHWGTYNNQVQAFIGEGGEVCRVLANYKNDKRFLIESLNTVEANLQTPNTVKLYSHLFIPPAKIKHFAASQGKADVINLHPALDPTGTPCMFDLVSKQPFYNNGTGDFLYPGKETQATTYSLRRPRMYAQKTEHGIRRLYHVPKGYNGTPEEYAAEHGFKVLVETEEPEEGYWAPQWRETEDTIELVWIETEPPAEEELLTEA